MKLNGVYKNIISNIAVQITAVIIGMFIPRLIIRQYGSALNGMVSSIGQFLTYAGLVEAGVGNVAVTMLFKPLAEKEEWNVSVVLSEAAGRYQKAGILYLIVSLLIAFLYPLAVQTQMGYFYTFHMVMILAMVGIIDYFIIGRYKVLLIADNRYYIINTLRVTANIVLLAGSALLLNNGVSLLVVKGFSVVIHMGEALFIEGYVRREYPQYFFRSNTRIKLEQQSSAMLMQLCMVVTYNTDLIVLTFGMGGNSLLEISVYSVYSLVLSFAKNMVSVFTTGTSAVFGELYAKRDMVALDKRFRRFELVYDICLFVIYSCFLVLIIPFLKCYIGDVEDVNYVRLHLAVLFCVAGLASQLKDVYQILVVSGCGAYKRISRYAVYEAIINLSLSLALVTKLGIAGVMIGTIVSHLFMDYGMIRNGGKVLSSKTFRLSLSRIMRNGILYIAVCSIEMRKVAGVKGWGEWIAASCFIVLLNMVLFFAWNGFFERDEFIEIVKSFYKKGKRHTEQTT